jgi:hypothetical protein
MNRSTLAVMFLAGTTLLLASGCTSYYKVTDPTTGKVYYSTHIKDLRDGATQLKDEKSKTEVTIQNSQVQKITKDQYEAALYAQPAKSGM